MMFAEIASQNMFIKTASIIFKWITSKKYNYVRIVGIWDFTIYRLSQDVGCKTSSLGILWVFFNIFTHNWFNFFIWNEIFQLMFFNVHVVQNNKYYQTPHYTIQSSSRHTSCEFTKPSLWSIMVRLNIDVCILICFRLRRKLTSHTFI